MHLGLTLRSSRQVREGLMVRVIVAMLVGAVLAIGGTVITNEVLTGVSNGKPTNQNLYNYGTR